MVTVRIGILVVGDELTRGMIGDRNTAYLARAIQEEGWEVSFSTLSGDGGDDIAAAFRFLLARSRAVVVTGGLGPTADDRTTEFLARTLGRGCYIDERALRHIRERFTFLGIPWTENNAKQAVFPEGPNPSKIPWGRPGGMSWKKRGKSWPFFPVFPRKSGACFPKGFFPVCGGG